ncbi:hypothetical protein D3OALGA1CA_107 [Olavius algarvensis associated proteobacterium Delta 3]|nr:hypothetical protein D3OALGA1CA_107 [Olavius algarvensis associated proteobacterium Delta 3]
MTVYPGDMPGQTTHAIPALLSVHAFVHRGDYGIPAFERMHVRTMRIA